MEEVQVKKASKRKRHRTKNKEKASVDQSGMENQSEKSKEQIKAERQAKKAVKKQNKNVPDDKKQIATTQATSDKVSNPAKAPKVKEPTLEKASSSKSPEKVEKSIQQNVEKLPAEVPQKSRDQVQAEREAKKLEKQAAKKKGKENNQKTESSAVEQKQDIAKISSDTDLAKKMESLHLTEEAKQIYDKKTPSKAERRALQEAQRAAKAKAQQEKSASKPAPKTPAKSESKPKEVLPTSQSQTKAKSSNLHKVKQFKHLYTEKCNLNINVNGPLHPAVVKLGVQYANDIIVGSNARCYAFLNALKTLINDYETPKEKIFSRGLESEIQLAVEFLQKCRPLAVSMINALKHLKCLISQETSSDSDSQKKERIMSKIDTYAHEQIETAAIAISLKVREKISNDDVILTFGCSSLIKRSLVEAWKDGEKKFSVIVVDSRPDHEGQEMLQSLTMEGISCTYVLINAISFIMPKVTKVLLGAHALLANGYVMSRVGTAQISMVANYFNVPVLICCETHKFSERVQTDSFVYNELGDPNALARNKNSKTSFEYLKDWESIPHLTPLNLRYDLTPPELITAVVTEVALLPCTSVQVILRVKPAE